MPGCVGWIAGVEPISERVLRAATKLRVISRNGTGTDNIPLGVAKELGIRIERAEGANARGVAELSIALMFAALRNIPELHHALRGGQWQRRGGIEISDRLVVLIGCGAVGRLVVQMALGLGARTAAYDPFPNHSFTPAGTAGFDGSHLRKRSVPATSSVCIALPWKTVLPLFSRSVLERLKEGCCLVNTARATLVDEAAVLDSLENGRLAGLCDRCLRSRTAAAGSPLLAHPRVIATPHIGGFTEESVRRATEAAVHNLLAILA